MPFPPKPPRGPARPPRPGQSRPGQSRSGPSRSSQPPAKGGVTKRPPREDGDKRASAPRRGGTLKPVARDGSREPLRDNGGWSPDSTPQGRIDDGRRGDRRDDRRPGRREDARSGGQHGGRDGGAGKLAWGDKSRARQNERRGDGRGRDDARPAYGEQPRDSYGDKPRGTFGDKHRGTFGDKPRGNFGDRPLGDVGDRPRGNFGDRPRGNFGDKPRGDFGDKPRGNFGDRPRGNFGDRPRGDFGDRPRGDFGDRPRGNFGDRPRGAFGDKGRTRDERGGFESRGGRRPEPVEPRVPAGPAPYERIADDTPFEIDPEGERIAKILARAGIASRRDVERMIVDGRIAINDELILTPATIITTLKGITVDGKPVGEPEVGRLWAFHKPDGLITAERDPAGRPTIYTALRNALPPGTPRLMPVGRLDFNTEGLLLLTNDGELKRAMELPSTGVPRTYRARTFGDITQPQLEELAQGIEIDGIRYGSINANMERRTGRNQWVEVTLTEGKNREVRRVLEHLGLQVSRLLRVAYGPFLLGDLPRGAAVPLPQKAVKEFRRSLKIAPKPDKGEAED
ncbi:MAG: pseudouridine synthase [Sphingomonadales bacterium]|nr:pseudouridine synthase [Sphingomonadales bacterium]